MLFALEQTGPFLGSVTRTREQKHPWASLQHGRGLPLRRKRQEQTGKGLPALQPAPEQASLMGCS